VARPEERGAEDDEEGRGEREAGGQRDGDCERHRRADRLDEAEPGDGQGDEADDHGRRRRRDDGPDPGDGPLGRRRPRGRAPAAVGRPGQLLAVAADEEDRVVGADPEDEDDHERLDQRADLDARLGDPAQEAPRDEIGGPDRQERHEGRQRGPVDGEQDEDDEEDRHDRRAVGSLEDGGDVVGADPGRPGHANLEPGGRGRGGVVADPGDGLVRALLEGDHVEPDGGELGGAVLAAHLGRARRVGCHRHHAEHVVADRGRRRRVGQPGGEGVAVAGVLHGEAALPEEGERRRRHGGVGRERRGADVARLDRLHVGRQEARLVRGADAGERRREHQADARNPDPGGDDEERGANHRPADPVEHRRAACATAPPRPRAGGHGSPVRLAGAVAHAHAFSFTEPAAGRGSTVGR
jgi:hypothetical protein